jgi:hypothetical protein
MNNLLEALVGPVSGAAQAGKKGTA